MEEKSVVQWMCDICGDDSPVNSDDYLLTAEPVCERCEQVTAWEIILTYEEQTALNKLLEAEQAA